MKKTNSVLDKIVEKKSQDLKILKKNITLKQLKELVSKSQMVPRDFYAALSVLNKVCLMAEIKKASPSSGILVKDFDHVRIAKEYEQSNLVSAISVITESNFFQGDISFLESVKEVTTMPIFRKDFIFEEYQIYESIIAGADGLLLIAALLDLQTMKKLITLTHKLGMGCLIETHSKAEIELAVEAGARCIGINARNLHDFTIDHNLFAQLSRFIPDSIIKVAESGIESNQDVKKVVKAGANAILVGTSIMKAENKDDKIRELITESK